MYDAICLQLNWSYCALKRKEVVLACSCKNGRYGDTSLCNQHRCIERVETKKYIVSCGCSPRRARPLVCLIPPSSAPMLHPCFFPSESNISDKDLLDFASKQPSTSSSQP